MITSRKDLEAHIHLTTGEARWFDSPSSLPLLISDHLAKLMEDREDDPIRRQFVPDIRECDTSCSIDPLAEVDHSVTSRLIHRYGHRAALLTTDRCFSYCRHCFRRRFTGTDTGAISDEEIDKAADYLSRHDEIHELLLTGGDMFTLSNDVTAMNRSAEPTPHDSRSANDVAEPTSVMMSHCEPISCNLSSSMSSNTMSCCSCESILATWQPTAPAPAMIIFISSL